MSTEKDIEVKVCGITSVKDALMVAEAGADYIGVITGVDFSPRRLSIEEAQPICENSALPVVMLCFNWEAEQTERAVEALHPHAVQLMGQESPSLVRALKRMVPCQLWKSIHLPPREQAGVNIRELLERINAIVDAGIDTILIDTVVSSQGSTRYGGTGQINDWETAQRLVEVISVPTFLAGGIKPENVQQAIEMVRPHGIDLCSGVEYATGKKDAEKLRQLMQAVYRARPTRG